MTTAARSVIGHDSVPCSDHTHAKLCLRGAVYSHSGLQCQSRSACPLCHVYTCQIWEPELSFAGLENTEHAGLSRLRPSPHACVMSLPGVWDEGTAGILDWRPLEALCPPPPPSTGMCFIPWDTLSPGALPAPHNQASSSDLYMWVQILPGYGPQNSGPETPLLNT